MAKIFGLPIVRPFGMLLMAIYNLVGSYGLAIILFALLSKFILMPLSIKSKKSMRKMSALSSKQMALQKKYANNRVKLNEELSSSKIDAACKAMEEAVAGVADCTATVQQYGMTDDLTSQLSTGLTIKIYGTDAETLTALSEKVIDIVNSTDGFQNATNGLGAGDSTIILQVDRDKVRAYGLTVARVYQQIAAKLMGEEKPTKKRGMAAFFSHIITGKKMS